MSDAEQSIIVIGELEWISESSVNDKDFNDFRDNDGTYFDSDIEQQKAIIYFSIYSFKI